MSDEMFFPKCLIKMKNRKGRSQYWRPREEIEVHAQSSTDCSVSAEVSDKSRRSTGKNWRASR